MLSRNFRLLQLERTHHDRVDGVQDHLRQLRAGQRNTLPARHDHQRTLLLYLVLLGIDLPQGATGEASSCVSGKDRQALCVNMLQ